LFLGAPPPRRSILGFRLHWMVEAA